MYNYERWLTITLASSRKSKMEKSRRSTIVEWEAPTYSRSKVGEHELYEGEDEKSSELENDSSDPNADSEFDEISSEGEALLHSAVIPLADVARKVTCDEALIVEWKDGPEVEVSRALTT